MKRAVTILLVCILSMLLFPSCGKNVVVEETKIELTERQISAIMCVLENRETWPSFGTDASYRISFWEEDDDIFCGIGCLIPTADKDKYGISIRYFFVNLDEGEIARVYTDDQYSLAARSRSSNWTQRGVNFDPETMSFSEMQDCFEEAYKNYLLYLSQ